MTIESITLRKRHDESPDTSMSKQRITNRHKADRIRRLLPDGVPRWVRCYDNGGESLDRYTVVFTGRYRKQTNGEFVHVGMNASPFHPQGIGQHGSSPTQIDAVDNGWGGVPIGRKCHLGKRVRFATLPSDCRALVLADYRELWGIGGGS